MGEYCLLYKTCSICGRIKYHTKFASNGRYKCRRKSYCHECKYFKRNGSEDIFNTKNITGNTSIKVRVKVTREKIKIYQVSYEEAVEMVREGMAGIVNSSLLFQFNVKEVVLTRDQYICVYCGERGNTVDHIIPKSKGGGTTLNNCVCACEKCNLEKANLSLVEYLCSKLKERSMSF
jgi:HNH endonuclease